MGHRACNAHSGAANAYPRYPFGYSLLHKGGPLALYYRRETAPETEELREEARTSELDTFWSDHGILYCTKSASVPLNKVKQSLSDAWFSLQTQTKANYEAFQQELGARIAACSGDVYLTEYKAGIEGRDNIFTKKLGYTLEAAYTVETTPGDKSWTEVNQACWFKQPTSLVGGVKMPMEAFSTPAGRRFLAQGLGTFGLGDPPH